MSITQIPNVVSISSFRSETDNLIELSDTYLSEGRYSEAYANLNQVLLLGKFGPEIYSRLGYVKYCCQEYEAAMNYYHFAVDEGVNSEKINNKLGLLYLAMGDVKLAEECFLLAMEDPESYSDACLNMAKLSLAKEDYQTGWEYYCGQLGSYSANIPVPSEWENKTVLIYGHINPWQELFFLRFLSELKKYEAKKISYYCNEKFRVLLKGGVEGVDVLKILPVEAQYDVIIPITELPGVLSQSQILTFLKPISFGRPNASNVKVIRNLLPNNGKENIAVAWESFDVDSNGLKMRISPQLLGECLRYRKANILVIQKNPNINDIRSLEKGLRRKIFNYSFVHDSIDDSNAFLSEMDRYITIGDQNIHLVYGLNEIGFDVKVSIMVTYPSQWQWLASGNNTPWFPGFTLCRQDVSGSWEQACIDLQSSFCE